jgi:hypothetical protein
VYVVDAVPISPMRSVPTAIADSHISGSGGSGRHILMLSAGTGRSAKKIACSLAAAARQARAM